MVRACAANDRIQSLTQRELALRSSQALQQSQHMMRYASETWMPTLTIRNVDPAPKEGLRLRAGRPGRSMEAEPRHILKEARGGKATPICYNGGMKPKRTA